MVDMTDNLYWNEQQLKAINAKSTDVLATEVWEVLSLYWELSQEEKQMLKSFLKWWVIGKDGDFSEDFGEIKKLVDWWSENTKSYCYVKLAVQDDLMVTLLGDI